MSRCVIAQSVIDKGVRKFQAVKRWMETHRDQRSHQGTVVEAYRTYRGRKLGPYHRLAYRDRDGRQRSIYLGASAELAEQVRGLLVECQADLHEQRERRRVRRILHAELKKAKALWADESNCLPPLVMLHIYQCYLRRPRLLDLGRIRYYCELWEPSWLRETTNVRETKYRVRTG